ncbi:hypothetical protein N7517_001375 [Penicillium concentricum]|uniref:Uncharacterized protein n=1 Tax=Penicillium concentricum TaxID=293559 RepID=A0A9W9STX4_9EURO|nr:uncharacterized protein N7517_001375 [Penicillium concentricum]KAJ5383464.1 hypothetical protein N7517_001375 [Penicillium concentricum]
MCLVLVDVWDSSIIEVSWLIIAFALGISQVVGTIKRPEKMGFEASLTGFNDWSFGQVASMVTLVAPLITIIDYFQEEDEARAQDEAQPVPPEIPLPSISNLILDPNDPDKDWTSHGQIFGLIDWHIITLVCGIFFSVAHRDPLRMIKDPSYLFEGILIFTTSRMVVPILCSLMVDTVFAEAGPMSTSYNALQMLVKLHGMVSVFGFSIYTKMTSGLLPLLIIGAVAYRLFPFFKSYSQNTTSQSTMSQSTQFNSIHFSPPSNDPGLTSNNDFTPMPNNDPGLCNAETNDSSKPVSSNDRSFVSTASS